MAGNRAELRIAPRGMVFDLDGVLFDSGQTHLGAYVRAFQEAGVPWPRSADAMVLSGASRSQVIAATAPHADASLRDHLAKAKGDHVLAALAAGEVYPIPGTAALARTAKARGLRLAVASNSKVASHFLQHGGVADLFEHVAVSSETLQPKPAPDVYVAAVNVLGLPPADCVAIEDSSPGVRAAHTAGLAVIRFGAHDDTGLAIATFDSMERITTWLFGESTEQTK